MRVVRIKIHHFDDNGNDDCNDYDNNDDDDNDNDDDDMYIPLAISTKNVVFPNFVHPLTLTQVLPLELRRS
jgi:hypothetical protein